MNDELYTGLIIWNNLVWYNLQIRKLLETFESLLDSVAAVLGIIEREPRIRAILEVDE